MTALQTAQLGVHAICEEIERRGGQGVQVRKYGDRYQVAFAAKDGKSYTVSPRTKRSGTWQTSIAYGRPCLENDVERDFWLFVDIGCEPPRFYIVPAWWIANDIYETHQKVLESHGGHRKLNDDSNHHGISEKRIAAWEGCWEQLGL